jgi:hypothetical protein
MATNRIPIKKVLRDSLRSTTATNLPRRRSGWPQPLRRIRG